MPKIFISYRRDDSQYVTDAIYSEMCKHFGNENVFLDVDDIPPGVDFPEFLAGEIASVDAVLVIIGQDWARIIEERAEQLDDFVRIEIESALEQGKLVIPVLVKNASMPNFSDLPKSVHPLQRKNAVPVRRHPDMERDCERLANGIERAIKHNRGQVKPTPVKPASVPPERPRQQPAKKASVSSEKQQPVSFSELLKTKSIPSEELRQQPVPAPHIMKPKFTLPDLHWIDISAGKVTIEAGGYVPKGGQTFDVPAFSIAKYPVTNKQYAEYVKERGKEPKYWNDSKWNEPMQPVVGVSWHDSITFCDWLSEKSGDKILLPTEQQWQRTAQGDDGRKFPWGNQWDASRCNSEESGIGKTTPVTAYEGKGDSPYGVIDMSGNVWEWCLTAWRTGDNSVNGFDVRRVLRGGSWDDSDSRARAVYRLSNSPGSRYFYSGFRLCVPLL